METSAHISEKEPEITPKIYQKNLKKKIKDKKPVRSSNINLVVKRKMKRREKEQNHASMTQKTNELLK